MSITFAETLKKLRISRGLSQQQLAERVYVNRSAVANWETGRRIPDAIMIRRLSNCLGTDPGILLGALDQSPDRQEVIMVDDEEIILTGGMEVLAEVLEEITPQTSITGFTDPAEALEYAQANRVTLAFLDIEMGPISGLDLCRQLLAIDPQTRVVFLTAHKQYAFDAWDTGASGFLMKPLSAEDVRKLLVRLHYLVND